MPLDDWTDLDLAYLLAFGTHPDVDADTYPRTMPEDHIPKPYDRPDVLVHVEGAWWPGEVRMQSLQDDGTWTIHANYRRGGGTFFATFTANDVRPDDTDYSRGRG